MKHQDKVSWIDNQNIYHILVDRFTGDSSLKNENKFLGGTILGILQKLDYIQKLGFNTIWLSPICQSKNYHGYHITDFMNVDPHFGTIEDAKTLINEVHRRGMYILTDFVPNHCADTHPFFIEASQHKESPYRNWFYFRADGSYKCFMNFDELPKLNLNQPDARKYMIEASRFWCRLGFDGLRIDHAIGPSFSFWNTWMRQMKQEFPDKVFFGEVWGSGLNNELSGTVHLKNKWTKLAKGFSQEELQHDYVGVLDGVLDFEFLNILLTHLYRGEQIENNQKLDREIRLHFSKYPADFKLFLFLDNHDLDRILFHCKGDVRLLEQLITFAKKWKRPFILYYGTELGMQNKETIFSGKPYADLAVRECVDWKSAETIIRKINQ